MADADPIMTVDMQPRRTKGAVRKRLFTILGLVILVGAIGYGLYWFLIGRNNVTTDNAYVGADSAQVAPLTAAAVLRVRVMETQTVKAGDVLVELDPADARVALDQAEAQLASARRRVSGYYANDRALAAQVTARGADIAAAAARVESAESDLAKARIDLDRRQALAASGAVSGEELTSVRNRQAAAVAALATARAARAQAVAQVTAAQGSQAVATALISGSSAAQNPEVRAAAAAVTRARLDLDRTVIRAPIAGVVARKSVQVGQRVAPGTPLMTIVPVETAFVDANFKESQLQKVRIGQPVTLTSDLYGGDVVYHGTVTGLAGGTGAAFALIPAQNATGNWIKVVQRLPVRITLKPEELRAHPLRIGLSMEADIDISGAN
ncbi:HlyD family efflux transporter periplasmic adaptor subunit [Sandarakinorhabdus sp. DWP1-3-1]|uniref:HlyD family efflux transporter periplasmic adaptor subunit n=1 Tax=Sandarakinorhabdus sp. DWP1-3-1 TaxID=2804627 RepID=UPI003CE85A6F